MFSLFYGSMSAGIASPRPPAPCAPTERSHRTAADKKTCFGLGVFLLFFFLFAWLPPPTPPQIVQPLPAAAGPTD